MDKLQESFEKVVNDLYTIDWSESDGRVVKAILKTYFTDIPNNLQKLQNMFENCTSLNTFQKLLSVKMLKAC